MGEVTAVELRVAMTQAYARPGVWRALVGALEGVRGVDPATVLRVRAAAEGDVGGLADELAEQASTAPEFARALRGWVDAGGGVGGPVGNTVSGDTSIDGHLVQAHHIQGGVHFHAPASVAVPAAPAVPRQLLPVPADFTGRTSELATLDELVGRPFGGPAIVVISGSPGVGKTTLASRWLSALADEFPDGQLYADLRGHSGQDQMPAGPGEILGQFLRAIGAPHSPAGLGEQAALWRSHTAGLRLAVMLDNAVSAAQVRPLLPGGSGTLVAVTSRSRLTGLGVDGAAFVQLGALAVSDAVDLLRRRIGADRVGREPEAARQVVTACAGLPLAVCVAAARMAVRPRQPLAAMAGALDRDGGAGRLDTLSIEGGYAVRGALDESYRHLPPGLAVGYRRLGLLPVVVFGTAVAAAACSVRPDEAALLLDDLAEVNLLEELGPDPVSGADRYRFHDLTRAHAADLAGELETSADRRDTVRRVVDAYLFTATAAEALLAPSHRTLPRDYAFPPDPGQRPPFSAAPGALNWLSAELPHLMAALRAAAEHGWDATAWQLADAMWPAFLRLRPYDLWIEAHEIGLAAARRAGERQAESRMLTSGGTGLRNAGRHDDAVEWFAQAREEAVRDGDRRAEAQALHGLGQSHRLAGRLAEAATFFTPALDLREEIGYRRGAALTRICLGDVALAVDRPEQAVPLLERARADLLAEHDAYDAARALAFLGRASARLPRAGRTVDDIERQLIAALGEFEETGSRHWQGRVLEMLGESAEERQDGARARNWYEQSLARYAQVSATDVRRLEERLDRLDRPSGRSPDRPSEP